MAWIQAHQSLMRHHKIFRLAELLDIHRAQAVGHMIALWAWALDNAPKGDLSALPRQAITLAAEWDGPADDFLDAATTAGFLDGDAATIAIHNWDDYAGRLIYQRQRNVDKQRRYREAHARAPLPLRDGNITGNVTGNITGTVTEHRREEKRREEKSNNDGEHPAWMEPLDANPKWKPKDMAAVIAASEKVAAQRGIDLAVEASKAALWLQTSNGRKKIDLVKFWSGWIGRAKPEPARNGPLKLKNSADFAVEAAERDARLAKRRAEPKQEFRDE